MNTTHSCYHSVIKCDLAAFVFQLIGRRSCFASAVNVSRSQSIIFWKMFSNVRWLFIKQSYCH